jgi:hypothetical protein
MPFAPVALLLDTCDPDPVQPTSTAALAAMAAASSTQPRRRPSPVGAPVVP